MAFTGSSTPLLLGVSGLLMLLGVTLVWRSRRRDTGVS
ncbi:MAG: LPXTG cell wall anchor domain-containing protein [Actinobacteria bacterium]|nr:LPXTG cell wall anchor domain-containing protein [Actinomycetota bacterium]MCB9390494.1 LPXTG cell wall anchor domain-containing protein [Acidimicrobiia bacterium]